MRRILPPQQHVSGSTRVHASPTSLLLWTNPPPFLVSTKFTIWYWELEIILVRSPLSVQSPLIIRPASTLSERLRIFDNKDVSHHFGLYLLCKGGLILERGVELSTQIGTPD